MKTSKFFILLFTLLITVGTTFNLSADTNAGADLYKLNLTNADDETVNLSRYKDKVILLNFWATWCPPCVKEMPSMQRLREHFNEQPFEVIAINVGESSTAVSSFLLEIDTPLTFPILLDEEGLSYRTFGVRGLPMTLLLDKNGAMLKKVMGEREWDNKESIEFIQTAINN